MLFYKYDERSGAVAQDAFLQHSTVEVFDSFSRVAVVWALF